MLPEPFRKRILDFCFLFQILGKRVKDGNFFVPKSEPLYPKLSPWLLKDKGDSFAYSSRDTKNKGVTTFSSSKSLWGSGGSFYSNCVWILHLY